MIPKNQINASLLWRNIQLVVKSVLIINQNIFGFQSIFQNQKYVCVEVGGWGWCGLKVNSKKERNWGFPGKDTALDSTALPAPHLERPILKALPATRFKLELGQKVFSFPDTLFPKYLKQIH